MPLTCDDGFENNGIVRKSYIKIKPPHGYYKSQNKLVLIIIISIAIQLLISTVAPESISNLIGFSQIPGI